MIGASLPWYWALLNEVIVGGVTGLVLLGGVMLIRRRSR